MIRNKYILFVFRLLVGGVFIWAGLLKIFDPLDFAQNISNYQIFPQGVSFLLALVLPWIETICGFFLILGPFQRASSLLTSLMLAGFVVLILITIARGIDTECGCFGSFGRKADYKLILADSCLFYFSLNLFYSEAKRRKGIRFF